VAVNAVVQRNGVRVGLLLTQGFEDMMEMGRVKMSDPFSLAASTKPPLVRKDFVRGVLERTDAKGNVIRKLQRDQLIEVATDLVKRGAQSLAVLFLHACRNASNELAAKRILQRHFPHVSVTTSTEVWPQIREYERATVLVMNSYVASKMQRYIQALDRNRSSAGITSPLFVSGSNGGVMPAARAVQMPITTLLSGPSAGAVAAVDLMRTSAIAKAITLDIGGTSADICVLSRQEIPNAWGQEIEGMPIAVPYVDISSIGSGGGSIAYADNLGMLRVGPDSAGAVPGPACYQRGGKKPTLTDAYVVSGFMDPANFAGGELPLSVDLANEAMAGLAADLGLDVSATAAGVIRVTTANLLSEFTRLSAKNGIDARDYVLMPFGGAGASHACFLADELQMRRIAIPVSPGTFCALGSVLADFRLDSLKTVYQPLAEVSEGEVADWFRGVLDSGTRILEPVRAQIQKIRMIKIADVRYLGQGFEVGIPFERISDVKALFEAEYRARYGPHQNDAPVEVTNLRATVIGEVARPKMSWGRSKTYSNIATHRRALFDGKWTEVPVFRRELITPEWSARGPFIVDQADTTCIVTKGWRGRADERGTLILEKEL